MDTVRLFRRRYMPDEMIELKDDIILHMDDDIIVTKWNSLKPRQDISGGRSAYFLKKGWKVSEIYAHDGSLVHWYCDIIETAFDKEQNAYTFIDLLIDILIYPDHHVEVVDMDEFADELEKGTLSSATAAAALRAANSLLQIIYRGEFQKLASVITDYTENQ